MLTATSERVARHTDPDVSARIRERAEASIRYHTRFPEEIPGRLRELDREWDVERALETGSASLTLLGLLLGATVNRRWLLLSLGVQGFFLQHALEGWCPPLPLLRELGVRTGQEIEAERHALLALLGQTHGPRRARSPRRPRAPRTGVR
jgi:hypothetical protein